MIYKKFLISLSIIGMLAFFLIGCQSVQQGPEDAYMRFWEACNSGDMATAESLVTEDAKDKLENIDVCIYTHDAYNRFTESAGTEFFQEFTSNSPTVELTGNTAYLRWIDTEGSDTSVIMYKIDGQWKVNGIGF